MSTKNLHVILLSIIAAVVLIVGGSNYILPVQAAQPGLSDRALRVVDLPTLQNESAPTVLQLQDLANSAEEVETCDPDLQNMVAYWPLDQGVSDPVLMTIQYEDVIGTQEAICQEDADRCPSEVVGVVGNALSFDGLDELIVQTNTLSWNNGDSFSVEAWVQTDQACTTNIVFAGKYKGAGGGFTTWWIGCEMATETAAFHLRDSVNSFAISVTGTTKINDGLWHHVVGVRDGSTGQNRIYVDGVMEGEESVAYTGNFISDDAFTLGFMDNKYYLNGLLDEVAVYDQALSTDEIASHYNDGLGQSYCNTAPIVVEPADQVSVEGDTVNLPIDASDPDYGDSLTYTADGLPSSLSIDENTGVISGTLTSGDVKETPYTVTVNVSDGVNTTSVNFSWTVYPKNQPPILTVPDDRTDAEGDVVTMVLTATDNEDDLLTFSASPLPPGLTLNPATGVISGVISYDAAESSPYTVVVTVSDGFNEDSESFSWTILNRNLLFLPLIYR